MNGQLERQGKLSQGTGLQCWCDQGAAAQGTAGGGSAMAQVARARQRELWWLGREKNEVDLKSLSPPSFYKLLGSRTATGHIFL